MDSIQIEGGYELNGTTVIQGSKNSTLPILAATLLIRDICKINHCPKISDVDTMVRLLQHIGCNVKWNGNQIIIDARKIDRFELPKDDVVKMRSSIMLMGALLGRIGQVSLSHPGGCVIGNRPIDIHLSALKLLQVDMSEKDGYIVATTKGLIGNQIRLTHNSVGATENCILAAVAAKGVTQIFNAAMEPEIVALCEFLKAAGAKIEGEGTSKLTIWGEQELHGTEFTVPRDRIVAGTYLFAGVICGGTISLQEAPVDHMKNVITVARRMNAQIEINDHTLKVSRYGEIYGIPYLKTQIYPGFPTDLQSALLVACTLARQKSVIEETIFENRFKIVKDLKNMGAILEVVDSTAYIEGNAILKGRTVKAEELRGGAALVLAGMAAQGVTTVCSRHFIDRGYEKIGNDLRELGAHISYR